jgi:catechol-2,3-dioxygenase
MSCESYWRFQDPDGNILRLYQDKEQDPKDAK